MTSLTAIGQVWVFKMPSDVRVSLYKNNPSHPMAPPHAVLREKHRTTIIIE